MPEVIFNAVNIPLSEMDCKILNVLLERFYTSEKDIKDIIQLMEEIASPYSRQLEIMDSIPGIDKLSALLILAEIGNEPQVNFEIPQRLSSWTGLVPGNDESAGKIYSRKILPGFYNLLFYNYFIIFNIYFRKIYIFITIVHIYKFVQINFFFVLIIAVNVFRSRIIIIFFINCLFHIC